MRELYWELHWELYWELLGAAAAGKGKGTRAPGVARPGKEGHVVRWIGLIFRLLGEAGG
jgi:hypothetical protein